MPPRTLHVTNGDATVPGLRAAGIEDPVLPWRDVLHEGPVPAVEAARLRRLRAQFIAAAGWADAEAVERDLEARDAALAGHDGPIVLWFEADLYDQLQLVQILAAVAERGDRARDVELVCIGEHPDVPRFTGLGQLDGPQLGALARERVDDDALHLAATAWDAFRASAPTRLPAVAGAISPSLHFVGEAFDRLEREYPSTRDGLGLTERRILAALADGPDTAEDVFMHVSAHETRPFLGDLACFLVVDRLAEGPEPLVARDGPRTTGETELAITAAGRAVLAGEADRAALGGLDRWIGGVHLEGPAPAWRWDEGTERVVAA
jgi:hypothetical protein